MGRTNQNNTLLIEECLKGNPLAQDRLFEYYYGFVYSICKRYSKNEDSTKEMLNDTFYRCFKKLDKYDLKYPFEPWLRKLCVNCCLRHIEKYKRKIDFDTIDKLEVADNQDHIFLPEVEDLNYLKLLEKLPHACRIVINLYVIEEYKHHEIAEKLNISVGTSKSNLHRAKKLLFEMLEKKGKNSLKLKSTYGR